MLKKLLKYDLKKIYKILVIFYILAIFFAILTRLIPSINDIFILSLIGSICSGATISMFFNIIINNIMSIWARFKNNFYGDESYLTHTLPVTKKDHYLAISIASLITLFTSTFIIILSILIAYYSSTFIDSLKSMFAVPLVDNSEIYLILILLIILIFLELSCIVASGITGLILGHMRSSLKVGYSVIYGFITYIIIQILVIISLFITSLFNSNIHNLLFKNGIITLPLLKSITFIAIVIYLSIFLVTTYLNLRLFKKGVNVE